MVRHRPTQPDDGECQTVAFLHPVIRGGRDNDRIKNGGGGGQGRHASRKPCCPAGANRACCAIRCRVAGQPSAGAASAALSARRRCSACAARCGQHRTFSAVAAIAPIGVRSPRFRIPAEAAPPAPPAPPGPPRPPRPPSPAIAELPAPNTRLIAVSEPKFRTVAALPPLPP